MGRWLDPADLSPMATDATVEQLDIIIADLEAQALLLVPCLEQIPGAMSAAVVSVLRPIALQWQAAGYGRSVTQETVGSMSYSVTVGGGRRSGKIYGDDLAKLRGLCGSSRRRRVFSVVPR